LKSAGAVEVLGPDGLRARGTGELRWDGARSS